MYGFKHQLTQNDQDVFMDEVHTLLIANEAVASHGRKAIVAKIQFGRQMYFNVTKQLSGKEESIVYSGGFLEDAVDAYNNIF